MIKLHQHPIQRHIDQLVFKCHQKFIAFFQANLVEQIDRMYFSKWHMLLKQWQC